MEEKKKKKDTGPLTITRWIGTTQSIIVHTIFFIVMFAFYFLGVELDQILLILTTAVSLEAIYLALFIQMTVNRNTESLEEVEEDIEEIQEDVEGLEGEFDDIQEDVEELSEDIDKMSQNSVPETQMTKTEDIAGKLATIAQNIQSLQKDIDSLKNSIK